MPSKKKKYNARFPAGRIKKIMQSDEEIGKVAQAVPVIISRTLELFVESLLTKTLKITISRNAKTLSTSHMKQCIMSEHRFDFLRELVKNIPDISVAENEDETHSSQEESYIDSETATDNNEPSTSRLNFQLEVPNISFEPTKIRLKRDHRLLLSAEEHSSIDQLPSKFIRSESTPARMCLSQSSMQPHSNPQSNDINASILNFDFSQKTLVNVSSMETNSKLSTTSENSKIEPILNIDLTNFVTTLATKSSHKDTHVMDITETSNSTTKLNNSFKPSLQNISKLSLPTNTSTHFELDEDYDNI